MANYRIFFPIVRTAKSQLRGDGGSRLAVENPNKRQAPVWDKPIPEFQTQAAVTAAVALGKCKDSRTAYTLAKDYEKHLKALAAYEKGFKPSAAAPRPNGSHNFTFGFSR